MTQSLEDYLEMIYSLNLEGRVARVKDISERLSVKKPSVVSAIRELSARNFIRHEKYGYIELTSEGLLEAQAILQKHNLIREFLMNVLGVSRETAEKDACRMEHVISDETVERIKNFQRIP